MVGNKPSEGSLFPWAGLSLADKFKLFWILDSGMSSFRMGLISDGNMESSLTLVSSRYRLRALPVMDACEDTTHFIWSRFSEAHALTFLIGVPELASCQGRVGVPPLLPHP